MEMIIIKRESNEWNKMWEWLGNHPINEGLEDPTTAFNDGEAWQYMGSFRSQDGRVIHEMRHRNHPKTNDRLNLKMNATDKVSDEDIEHRVPVK